MSSTTIPTTFSDLYTEVQNRVREATGVTAVENQAKRYINTALIDMHIGYGEKLYWCERSAILRTKETYTTGTVALTNGSTTVTGTSTLWNTNNAFGVTNTVVGGKMTFGGQDVYEVSTLSSDTVIVLTQAYIGDTESGASYTYFEDEYDLDSDFLRPLDVQKFSPEANIDLIDRKMFRRLHPRNAVVGIPTQATIIAKNPIGGVDVQRRIRLYRAPNNARLLPYSFVTNKLAVSSTGTLATSLNADTDEPIVPLQYRQAIVLGALYNWYRDKKDDTRSQEVFAEYVNLVQRIVADVEVGVTPRPRITSSAGIYRSRAKRPWRGGVRGRYTTGSAFDEIR